MPYDLQIINAVANVLTVVLREGKRLPLALRDDFASTLAQGIPTAVEKLPPPDVSVSTPTTRRE